MRTKLIAGITATLITLSGTGFTLAHADSDKRMGDRHENRIEKRIEHLTDKLNLTAEQQVKIKEQMLNKHEKKSDKHKARKDVFKKLLMLDPNAPDYQTQLNSLVQQAQDQTKIMILGKAKQQEELFEILTTEQEKQFIELKSEMANKLSKHDKGHKGKKKCH